MRLVSLLLLLAATASAQPVELAIDVSGVPLPPGATVGVRGDTPPLAWDRSLPLADPDGDGTFTGTVELSGEAPVAYKVVVAAPGEELRWEPGDNRLLLPGRMARDHRAFGGPQVDLPMLTLSQREVARDLAILRQAMETLHPGLRLHNTDAELLAISNRLNGRAGALVRRYGEAVPLPELYLAVAEAVAALRDGHTQVSMYNQGDRLTAHLYTGADRVPFAFRLVGDRMIVTGDATPDRALPRGTEILALDGRPVSDVLAALLPYASADGSNDAKRLDLLQVTGVERVAERFDVIYALLNRPEGELALDVRTPDGAERSLRLARTTADDRAAVLRERDPSLPRSPDDLLAYELRDDGTAVLTIGSFATFNMQTDYAAWLTSAFQDMQARGAERLVVDLRGVAGGMDDAAALLFAHLLAEPAEVTFWQGSTAYDVIPEALRPHVGSWTTDFYDLRDRVTAVGDGTFALPPRGTVTIEPAPDAFQGPRAVLVDATASSATFYLAHWIQQTGAAPLVGQTTGGSLKGLNAGQMVFLTLPHSGIVVDVPLYASRPPTPGPDRGVTPDVQVPLDADAVIAGRDPELDAALALLTSD